MKKDFLAVIDYSSEELQQMLDRAVEIKAAWKAHGNSDVLKDKSLGMIFQKPSLRTRVSFERGIQQLGGNALYLSPSEIGLGKRESIADVARVLSGYVDGIMARVFEHDHILQLAKWSSVPVINGLSDYNHPCQAMADALTIQEEFGSLKDRKVVFIGDGNNVAISLMFVCVKLGAHFVFSGPDGYLLKDKDLEIARKIGAETGSTVIIEQDPVKSVKDADVVYTDTWTSMGQEEEAKRREAVFPPYQVNEILLSHAADHVIVMHCLPAHRGQEITDEVADGPHSRLFPEAHNRMHAQKAILEYLLK
ncbi:MAG: ornithine carbamoyltransferase [Anaerolineae bacterium]|jgi:ornithine carbamoyltransferase|nr:ornithine carbamoyltransferase [Anaerolineae bacterium]